VVVEGNNGVGKSSAAAYIGARLRARLHHYLPAFVRFREESELDVAVAPVPRLVFYLAATLDLSDVVRDELPRGHVVCDRYLSGPLSLFAAKAWLGNEEVCRICAPFEPRLCRPDLTLLVTADHARACERIRARAGGREPRSVVERWTLDSPEFFVRRESSLRHHAARIGPVVEMDTTDLAIDDAGRAAWRLIASALDIRTETEP
jgi:thymidylate kinase